MLFPRLEFSAPGTAFNSFAHCACVSTGSGATVAAEGEGRALVHVSLREVRSMGVGSLLGSIAFC